MSFTVLEGALAATWYRWTTMPTLRIAAKADSNRAAVGATVSVSVLRGGGSVSATRFVLGADGEIRDLQWTLGPDIGLQQIVLSAAKGRTDTLSVVARSTSPEHPGDGIYVLFEQSGLMLPSRASGMVSGQWMTNAMLTGAIIDIVDHRFTVRHQFANTQPAAMSGEVIEQADRSLTFVAIDASGMRATVATGRREVNDVLTLLGSSSTGPWFAYGLQKFVRAQDPF
ncbi:MAG: hypothetical protein K2R93_02740 [Gemmatimonadaceae bacterium]|nr:hypothetical protein [Gemmatimonadaceae bacterium]